MSALLIMFNCSSSAGYAMDMLQRDFVDMGLKLVGDFERIHVAFTSAENVGGRALSSYVENVIELDSSSTKRSDQRRIEEYVSRNHITMVFGMDQPVSRPAYTVLRRGGVRKIISYYGAPMSSLNTGVKLFLKRIDVALRRSGPDHYIFESEAMALTATHGRGIHPRRTSVVYLGVDTERFAPDPPEDGYLSHTLRIPEDRKVVVYSGHMEERKGVGVLMEAAAELVEGRGRRDVHFLLVGNRPGEEHRYVERLKGSDTYDHVTFGGYRRDLPQIFPACHMGVIASTGWDSFTVSALEKAASGLPLIVSEVGGLVETVETGVTGLTFQPGNVKSLADKLQHLLDDETARKLMSQKARQRAIQRFAKQRQINDLVEVCRSVYTLP